jgi:hypothetical protein
MTSPPETICAFQSAALGHVETTRLAHELEFYVYHSTADFSARCEITKSALDAIKSVTAQWLLIDISHWTKNELVCCTREASQINAITIKSFTKVGEANMELVFASGEPKIVPLEVGDLEGYCAGLTRQLL